LLTPHSPLKQPKLYADYFRPIFPFFCIFKVNSITKLHFLKA